MFRVAITGAGVVTPIGIGLDAFVEAMRKGTQGISQLAGVPIPRGKAAAGLIHAPEFDTLNRAYRMASVAIVESLKRADFDRGTGEDVGLIVSTIGGDSRAAEDLYAHWIAATDPVDDKLRQALRLYPNGELLNVLGNTFGFWGPRLVITNACASGNIASGLALDLLRLGRCRAVVVVGVEILKLSMVWGAERAGFIGRALRPFHRYRDGSVLGEGAAALVVERSEQIGKRSILGWLEGFGCVCDRGAAAITLQADGSGLRRSMKLALEDSGRCPSDLEYVNAHAPGTPAIDFIECKAIADLCGNHAASVSINSTKSLTTHLSGASGVVEVIATLLQMRDGFLHPTAGLDEPDSALAIVPVGQEYLERRVTRSLSNACGGGGLNTSVMLTAPDEPEAYKKVRLRQTNSPIVVTGVGCISTLGAGTTAPLTKLSLQIPHCSNRLDWFNINEWYPRETNYSYMNRAAQLAAAAAAIAIADASLNKVNQPYNYDRIAVIAGTYLGGGPEASEVMCRGLLQNPHAIKPSMSLDHGLHLGATLVCRNFGFTGLTYTITGTSSSGLQAIAVAQDLLVTGRSDAVVVLGYDALDHSLHKALSLLSDCPKKHEIGEGAGAIVLERFDAAVVRQAPNYLFLNKTVMLSGSLKSRASLRRIAERLASQLVLADWEVVYLAASSDPRLMLLAKHLISISDKSAFIKQLQPWTNHCLAADSMIALTSAAANQECAVILSAETSGTIAASVVRPVEKT